MRAGLPVIDTALLMTAPPDRHGMLSLGVEVLASLAAAQCARQVVVQVNERMPRVLGNSFIHVSDVHTIVEASHDLPELLAPPPDEVERRIARNVVGLIPEKATLQLGIGGVPNAVISLLEGRNDIGIHSEMISDGVMHAFEAGVATGRYKTRHRGKIVTTFALGSRVFYDWLHENNAVEAHPCDHTNDPFQAAQNARLIAINSAISVDLTGQVNADSIGYKIHSGVGGQVDFIRAANLSQDGRPIIALPSTARGGTVSRIVPRLAEGAGVVTSRADVHTVVTEHGVAELRGRSIRERIDALMAVADPAFQPMLEQTVRDVPSFFHETSSMRRAKRRAERS
jgi:acyl-CoA hydrolase